MNPRDASMPNQLRELHTLEFDYADGEGIDFEPYSEFLASEETRSWIRAWTGNTTLEGSEYRVFGQDGTGGYAAFWCVRPGQPLLEQPIVFFGSEGELGVVASNLADYLWLLAGGVGPYEAVAYPGAEKQANQLFTAFARAHAGQAEKTPAEVLARAQAEFPEFEATIRALCR